MVDDEKLTDSEHVRLILAAALRVAKRQTPDDADLLNGQIAASLEAGDPKVIVNLLAMLNVGTLVHLAENLTTETEPVSATDLLLGVFAEMVDAEEVLKDDGYTATGRV